MRTKYEHCVAQSIRNGAMSSNPAPDPQSCADPLDESLAADHRAPGRTHRRVNPSSGSPWVDLNQPSNDTAGNAAARGRRSVTLTERDTP